MSDDPDLRPAGGGTAAPPLAARITAFVAIVVAGLCGGLIGYAVVDLQCSGDCGVWVGIGGLVGAVTGAVGVAVIAVLALRAMGEWDLGRNRR
jgi:hypothetical protein